MRIYSDKALSPTGAKVFQEAGHRLMVEGEGEGTDKAFLLSSQGQALPEALRAQAGRYRGLAILDGQAAPQDLQAFSRLGLPVLETGKSEAASQADFVLWKILEWARQGQKQGRELAGKTLGFWGFDGVAEQVAKRAQAFGMNLLATTDPDQAYWAKSFGCRILPWVDLLVQSQVLLMGPGPSPCPHPLAKDDLRLLPDQALLIRLGDLAPFHYEGLLMGLDFDYLSHAVFDLPGSDAHRAKDLARFPHVQVFQQEAGHTSEARLANIQDLAQDMTAMDQGLAPKLAINLPRPKDPRPSLQAWADLAWLMGNFLGQRLDHLPKFGEFYAHGPGARLGAPLLQAQLTLGLAQGLGQEAINLISARPWAQEQGFRLDYAEDRQAPPAFGLTLKTGRGLLSLTATLDDQGPLVTQVDGYRLQARPQGHILLIPHPNKPGMVGLAGRLLGSQGVNITGMVLGHQDNRKDRALMWILVSKAIAPTLLDRIRQEAEMHKAEPIALDPPPPTHEDNKGEPYAGY